MNDEPADHQPAAVARSNMRLLMVEAVCSAVFAACVAYNIPYLLRLGGTNVEISLLIAGAGLMQVFATLPFAAWMQRARQPDRWMIGSMVLIRLGHVVFIVAPWLPIWRSETIVVVLVALNIPVALFGVVWLPLQAEIIPVALRARVFARRNVISGITIMATSVLLSRWLEYAPFPLNYQLLYGLAIVAGMLATGALLRVRRGPAAGELAAPVIERVIRPHAWVDLLRTQPLFRTFLINMLIFSTPVLIATPLQPIYFVRELGVSDGWLGLWAACLSGGVILGNVIWQRVIERYGTARTMIMACLPNAIYLVLIALFPSPPLILGFTVLAGMLNPGIDLSTGTALYLVSPAHQRVVLLGLYTTLASLLAALLPLAALPLLDLFGMRVLLVLLAGARFAAALLFVVRPLPASPETPG